MKFHFRPEETAVNIVFLVVILVLAFTLVKGN